MTWEMTPRDRRALDRFLADRVGEPLRKYTDLPPPSRVAFFYALRQHQIWRLHEARLAVASATPIYADSFTPEVWQRRQLDFRHEIAFIEQQLSCNRCLLCGNGGYGCEVSPARMGACRKCWQAAEVYDDRD